MHFVPRMLMVLKIRRYHSAHSAIATICSSQSHRPFTKASHIVVLDRRGLMRSDKGLSLAVTRIMHI